MCHVADYLSDELLALQRREAYNGKVDVREVNRDTQSVE